MLLCRIVPFVINWLDVVAITTLVGIIVEEVVVLSQLIKTYMFEKLQAFVSRFLKKKTIIGDQIKIVNFFKTHNIIYSLIFNLF